MSNPDKPLPLGERTVTSDTGDGELIEAYPGMECCDFCLSTAIAFEHDCGTVMIEVGDKTHISSERWTTCADCHALIEAGDRPGLLRRAIEGITTSNETGVLSVLSLAELIAQFFERKRDSRPIEL